MNFKMLFILFFTFISQCNDFSLFFIKNNKDDKIIKKYSFENYSYNRQIHINAKTPYIVTNNASYHKKQKSDLSSYERKLLANIITHEVGSLSYDFKRYIAGIVYNRYNFHDKLFGKTIEEILTKDGQFIDIKSCQSKKNIPDEETYMAIDNVFKNGCPEIGGAIYYYNLPCNQSFLNQLNNPKYKRTFVASENYKNSKKKATLYFYAES